MIIKFIVIKNKEQNYYPNSNDETNNLMGIYTNFILRKYVSIREYGYLGTNPSFLGNKGGKNQQRTKNTYSHTSTAIILFSYLQIIPQLQISNEKWKFSQACNMIGCEKHPRVSLVLGKAQSNFVSSLLTHWCPWYGEIQIDFSNFHVRYCIGTALFYIKLFNFSILFLPF